MVSAWPASGDTLEARVAACLACHGEKGQSVVAEVPSLGAQPAFYLLIQLFMFRERMRVVEVMNRMTQGLSDDDLRSLADTIAKLPSPPPAGDPADPARMERARALIEQHRCNFCHNRDYSGEQSVVRALREYKNNTRRAYDASMADVLYLINDEQILDLAYFLARVR